MLELVSAYAPFANGGIAVMPHVVERIRTADGKKTLYAGASTSFGRVVDARYVAMMNAMMRQTLLIGTAHERRAAGLAGGRQDRHQPGFPRRLVHRLHRPSGRRRVARQRRFLADPEGDRRRAAGRDLEPVHEGRAPERADRRSAGARARRRIVGAAGAGQRPRRFRRIASRRPTAWCRCRSRCGRRQWQ